MSFVARPSKEDIEQPPAPETVIVNDGFFPDVDPAAVREVARVSTSITPARLRAAILGGIMTAEIDLRRYAADCREAGYAKLADVPADKLDSVSVQIIRYRRAVALFAKAELIERHRDFDTTAAGGNQADELSPSINELRRDAMHAVRDMLGQSRTGVWLI